MKGGNILFLIISYLILTYLVMVTYNVVAQKVLGNNFRQLNITEAFCLILLCAFLFPGCPKIS